VIGQTATNQSFSIAFFFLSYKDKENYQWDVNNLKKHVWQPLRIPKVFITDWDAALRNALHTGFPESQANLCTWHINKNITTNCKKYFPASISKEPSSNAKDNWEVFTSLWQQVTFSKTEALFDINLERVKVYLAT
jgi:hypothetical protein